MELIDCFWAYNYNGLSYNKDTFSKWLSKNTKKSEIEVLKDILDILLNKDPLADYFWYITHPGVEFGVELSYVPNSYKGPVSDDALRVDKEKIKIFLRDYKINQLIN